MNSSTIEFNVSSVEFIAAVLLAAVVFFWLPTVRLRQALWACGNTLVLWLLLPNLASLAVLALFLGSGYLVIQLLRRWPSVWLLAIYLVALVTAFLILKQYEFLGWLLPAGFAKSPLLILGVTVPGGALPQIVRITGLSYMLFRQIHVLVDAAQEQIERISLWSYLNYQLDLFTILAGPIQRYQDFEEQWRRLDPILIDLEDLLRNCLRLLLGVMKIALVAPLFFNGWNEMQAMVINHRVAGMKFIIEFLVVFYFYPIYLYFNFSGYCDIVIAACRFFGMKLPENFNRPFLARNPIDFWTRWHITLGLWIRDYLFMPMYKPVVERWPQRAQSLAWIFYFVAFVVAGVWHGSTLNFLFYGIWQGIGVSAAKLYENWLLARRGRKGLREYLQSSRIRFVAILLNLHFQGVSMLIFSQRDVGDTWQMFRGLILALAGHRY